MEQPVLTTLRALAVAVVLGGRQLQTRYIRKPEDITVVALGVCMILMQVPLTLL
jgi:ammonia channel protein AmtB